MRDCSKKRGVALVLAFLALRLIYQSLQFEVSSDSHKIPISPQTEQRQNENGGTFLGLDIVYKSEPRSSVVHCVGDNFLPKTSSGYRSCQFRHLCWDLEEKEFIIFQSKASAHLSSLLNNMTSPYVRTSSDFETFVSTSGTTEGRLKQGMDGQWFPRTVPMDSKGFYELPENVVLVPVDFPEDGSMERKDVLFDFFLPIFNLLAMFDLQNNKLLLANLRPFCETTNDTQCYREALEFMPLMNRDAKLKATFMTITDQLVMENGRNTKLLSSRICAKYGAAGIGALTDHGIHKKSHGERRKDYVFSKNSGQGPLLMQFRNHMRDNLGIERPALSLRKTLPMKITISISKSKKSGIQQFQKQMDAIHGRFSAKQVIVERHRMTELPIQKQVELAASTTIYISFMGEGAMPAFFLPRGATLILFYNDQSEFVSVSKREKSFPVKLYWDLWNNLSYVRVHWLPLSTKDEHRDLSVLLELIQGGIHSWMELIASHTAYHPEQKREPDGTFNGVEVRLVNNNSSSSTHCVGDNFLTGAHVYRSCQLRHVCIDLHAEQRKLSLAKSDNQSSMIENFMEADTTAALISTSIKSNVSIGHTIRFNEESAWFPAISSHPFEGFYELPADIVWAPFYAEQPNINNPGHLLWDYFLPIFNLLAMFGLEGYRLLLSNIDDSCTQEEDSPCWGLITKFLPMLGVEPKTFRNLASSELKVKGTQQSNIVCAQNSVAGIGMLTDHGWNRHGQRIEDYRDARNVGRGPLFFAFRNFVSKNMGIVEQQGLQRPHKVVFSTFSSKNPSRRQSFVRQVAALKTTFSDEELTVEQHVLSKLNLLEQIHLATSSTIFVSVVGGSACIATFLPRGSSVILFFNDVDEFADHSPRKDFPSMIDWDFWNNASYLRIHWLPIRTLNEDTDLQAFVELVRGEISTLGSLR